MNFFKGFWNRRRFKLLGKPYVCLEKSCHKRWFVFVFHNRANHEIFNAISKGTPEY